MIINIPGRMNSLDIERKNQEQKGKCSSGCDIAHVLRSGKGICILVLILFSLISSVQALKQPYDYEDNQCGLIAKDYQEVYVNLYEIISENA